MPFGKGDCVLYLHFPLSIVHYVAWLLLAASCQLLLLLAALLVANENCKERGGGWGAFICSLGVFFAETVPAHRRIYTEEKAKVVAAV